MPLDFGVRWVNDQHPPFRFGSIEDRIESALSSSNSILNFFLHPVRDFVGSVLHPVLWFADRTIDVVWTGVYWTWDRAHDLMWDVTFALERAANFAIFISGGAIDWVRRHAEDLYNQAISFASGARDWAVAVAQDLYNRAISFAQDVYNRAISFASGARDWAVAVAQDLYNRAISFADDVYHRAIDFASSARDWAVAVAESLVDTLRQWAEIAINDAENLARWIGDHVLSLAKDALDLFYRDVVLPIEHRLASFIDNEWHWAVELLHLVEDAAHWIWWVSTHLAGELIETYHAVKNLVDEDFTDTTRGVAFAVGRR